VLSPKRLSRHARADTSSLAESAPTVLDLMGRVRDFFIERDPNTDPFLAFFFEGYFTRDALPHYLRPANVSVVRERLSRLQFRFADICDAFDCAAFEAVHLSNIGDHLSRGALQHVASLIAKHTMAGARVSMWTLTSDGTTALELHPAFAVPKEYSRDRPSNLLRSTYDRLVVVERIHAAFDLH
jgi:S-adenosylmethionine:diacylglycerol 3-amino-3-carboxypropyl transferase